MGHRAATFGDVLRERRLRETLTQRKSNSTGFTLVLEPDQLDLLRFDLLVERAEQARTAGDNTQAWELYAQALGQWTGPVLSDAHAGVRQHPVALAVSQRRLTAALAWADLALAINRIDCVAALLRQLAREEPYHEALHARLMLVLAGCGQQSAVLQLYADLRARLSDELGVEPAAEVRDAHRRVLCQQVPRSGRAPLASAAETGSRSSMPAPTTTRRRMWLPARITCRSTPHT